ncbi:TetR family transcriptional regulator [Kineothrix alysoides]|uniref:TetR family transcriptional regulator n=1 Tax=Kineothrix alysoides TaxID=1469948 RepID=A0A4R1QY61_9FIRM|nr:TetR/AcrR family transcriptional regulator [Kineothrix alysoides]TCL57694.1 TetR family transcriptional regulator [Kineothrix alysoides]
MGIKERRDIEKAEMKKKIKDAAIELIEQEGYEKLSIRKIAAKIEYSPTTIYLYYKDKAEIITDMSSDLYHKIESNTAAIMSDDSMLSIDQRVHSLLNGFVTSLCDEPEMAKAIMYSETNVIFANENKNNKPSNSGIDMLDNFLADGIAQKVLKPNAINTSWMIISALLGFAMCAIENQLYKLEDFDRLVNDFVEVLMGGIRQ